MIQTSILPGTRSLSFRRGDGVSAFVEDVHAFGVYLALEQARLRETRVDKAPLLLELVLLRF